MIRMFLTFLLLTLAFWFGITAYRGLKKREAWKFKKSLAYSALCSALALVVITFIVVLF